MNAGVSKQGAILEWRDGVTPVSTQFDDPYYTFANGLEETRHVFLGGNDLPQRFEPDFHIAELGFGTGLNALATLAAWKSAGMAAPLRFTSFEAYPMNADDMARALAPFDALGDLAKPLLSAWAAGETQITTPDFILNVVIGDARKTLSQWQGRADCWFLDGFSPAKNPELWEASLLGDVASHTAPGGTCATYSAAGHVREKLDGAGFDVTRRPGFGHKRHMTTGVLRA